MFRSPMLAEGDAEAKRNGLREKLAKDSKAD